ncbi:MAG: DUF3137 domain-containing protein [Oscillospiraceae bacterium]|nr:DUF3137 domain-containing protein [Oscillospiraceae bacterium]
MSMQLQNEFSRLKSSVKGLKRFAAFFIFTGILLIIGTMYAGNTESLPTELRIFMIIAAMGSFITAVILHIIAVRKKWKLESFVTDNVTSLALSEVFELAEYAPNKGPAHSVIRNTGLIENWDNCYGSNMVRGRYKGISFEFSDIELTEEIVSEDADGKQSTSEHQRFKGQWLILETTGQIKSELRLRQKAHAKSAKSTIETENMAFNAKFQIESRDGLGTFMILTPLFMERIIQAKTLANGTTSIYFGGRQVHIAVQNNRNLFKLSPKKSAHGNIESLREYQRSEIRYITDILDVFLLCENLFG